ncbi:hypothetical protein K1719_018004 [Acacia pycnantha]|nr:hypothetical protein K1719_018004 [Acacia pycnantha]
MTSAPSKLYADDVNLLVVSLDTNPFFWRTFSVPFSEFISHVLAFFNSILFLSQLNQKLEEFVAKDEQLGKAQTPGAIASSLLSGLLSMALCCLYLVGHKQQLIDKEKLQMLDVMIYFCASSAKANRPRSGFGSLISRFTGYLAMGLRYDVLYWNAVI